MPKCRFRLVPILLAAFGTLAVSATQAVATQQGLIVIKKWQAMDKCTQKAYASHPDYTPQSNAQRAEAVQACLNGQNLPPRAPETPGR